MPADLVFLNGTVITIEDAQSDAEAVAVVGNRIAHVGSTDRIRAEVGPDTRVVDLAGRTLLPGFNDNHTHPISYGLGLSLIDARPAATPTLAGVQEAFRAAAASTPTSVRNGWLLARGYDDSRLDVRRHPTRQELDAATGGRPAFLTRTCGHLGVANSAALARAGVTRETPDPEGGQIDRDAHGEPTGLLRETAMRLVYDQLPSRTRAELKDALRAAGERFLAYGITSVGEAAIRTSDELAAYQELAAGELPVRVFTMMLIDDTLEALAGLGMRTGWGDDWLRIGPAKLFQDGSGGGRTAAMTTDYVNDPGNRGITIYDQDGLNERFARAHAAGFQLAAHAIGDLAITMILDAYETVLTKSPKSDHRFRIEHCGMCTPEIIDRMAAMQVVAVPQPNFIYEQRDTQPATAHPSPMAA